MSLIFTFDSFTNFTESCDVHCVRRQTERQLKLTIKKLRRSINKERFVVRFLGNEYEVTRNSLTTHDVETSCPLGHIHVEDDRCGKFRNDHDFFRKI